MEFYDVIKQLSFASYVWMLVLPVSMMGVDVLTGLVNAWSKQEFESTKMRSGLAKKVGEIAIILVGILFQEGMELPGWILNFIVFYIIVMELMSVIENLDKLGVPIPKFIKDVVNNIGDSIQNDSYAELTEKIAELEKQLKFLEGDK